MILLLNGQIHSDGTFGPPPVAAEAIRGEIDGDELIRGAATDGMDCRNCILMTLKL